MPETILGYQLLIAASLVVVRLAAPGALAATALGWSALSLINLIWPPLMALQLGVVWVTYLVIRPRGGAAASEASQPSESDAKQDDASCRAASQGPRAGSFPQAVANGLKSLEASVDRAVIEAERHTAVVHATATLGADLRLERDVLDCVLRVAKLGFASFADAQAHTDQVLASISRAMGASGKPGPKAAAAAPPVARKPVHLPPPAHAGMPGSHPDPQTDAAIRRKVRAILDEHERHLEDVAGRLSGDPALRRLVEKGLAAAGRPGLLDGSQATGGARGSAPPSGARAALH